MNVDLLAFVTGGQFTQCPIEDETLACVTDGQFGICKKRARAGIPTFTPIFSKEDCDLEEEECLALIVSMLAFEGAV